MCVVCMVTGTQQGTQQDTPSREIAGTYVTFLNVCCQSNIRTYVHWLLIDMN